MKKNEIEICDFEKVLRQFGIYRNTLPKEHNEFVKRQLQKDYDTITKTYNLQGRIYRGTFRENSTRKFNKEAYAKESKLATVLASFGFDVILIEENPKESGTKPDAIVNGIVMDFKEITAFYEKAASKNTLGLNYRDGMRKKHSEGVALFLHNFSETFVTKNMGFKETRRGKNGLALFFHEDTGKFQLIDMRKIRAAHFERPLSRRAPDVSIEPSDTF